MQITMTNGYASFKEWVDAGYPGARKLEKTTHLAKCQVIGCDGSMVANGYCLSHGRLYRRARVSA